MECIEDLERAGRAFGALVAGTALDQLGDPTPCTEWDVRALLNHVISGTQTFSAVVRGDPLPDRTIDQVKDDPSSAFDAALSDFVAALSEPGVLEGTFEWRMGPVSGERLARMRANEYLVHGWDLAKATGQPLDLPEDLVPGCLALYAEILSARPREPGGAFGLEVPVAPDASPIDRLAGFFGRTP